MYFLSTNLLEFGAKKMHISTKIDGRETLIY